MKNALQLVAPYEPMPAVIGKTTVKEDEFLHGLTAVGRLTAEQELQAQIDEMETLVADLREKLALTQWDLSQKETLLHGCLQREMELRTTMGSRWQY